MIRKILPALLLLNIAVVKAQQFNYVHYDTKDGLAGSTVYDMCQDKDGFMWFATENGLSRFDGSVYVNYTVKDGLPDNEVLKVYADNQGRVWIGTFNKQVCYYYKGKIHNKLNDLVLKQINLQGFLAAIVEDEDGLIAFSDATNRVLLLRTSEKNTNVSELIFDHKVGISLFYSCNGKRISISDFKNVFIYEDNKLKLLNSSEVFSGTKGQAQKYFCSYISCDGKKIKYILKKPNYILTIGYNNNLIFCSTYDGVWDVDTVENKWRTHYLEGKKISQITIDAEKNTWFSTMGEGVYKLSSRDIKTFKFPEVGSINNTEVFSIFSFNNQVVAGLDHGKAVFISKEKQTVVNYSGSPPDILRPQSNRLVSGKSKSQNSILLGFDKFLLKVSNHKNIYNYVYPIKSVDEVNNDSILVGTSSAALVVLSSNLKIVDTIWRERSTKVFSHLNKYYIGTLAGLYEINKERTYTYLGKLHHTLTRRITDIKAMADGTLWIATADEGLVAYKNKKITAVLKDSNGLSSNICKTIYLQGNYLWVGTNKGLDKVDVSNNALAITSYSSSDGLPSNTINAVYVEDSMVYVGSPAGLTVFNEKKISSFSICRLNMLQITAGGKEFDSLHNTLSHKANNIKFTYTAVSLKSSGDITYYYKLNGLNNDWIQTTQSTIEYPSLPPGNYTLHLYAVNKFGVKSETIQIPFTITAPFWKTGWFYALIAFFAVALTGWFVAYRNSIYRKKLEASNALQKQFAKLEQLALQAQMNPHFIFNCLNGIQQYILTGDKEKANEYLTCFARIIRQTLDNSGKTSISITQEAAYLKEYLEMEKMRSATRFISEIIIDEKINADDTEMPAMLLQPYVENALRHGLRYKTEGEAQLHISFVKKENMLQCIVKDNGAGRKHAAEIKSKQHIEYQSKGMSLTARRVDLLNKMNDTNLTVTINDLYNNDGTAAGTEVIIQIPF